MFVRNSALGAFLLLCISATLSAASINWRDDLNSARTEAAQADKLMMVDVYTDWCGWCKKLDNDTYSDTKRL